MTRPQNSDGRPQFHLRRISHRTLSTAANNICFSNRITFVGRGDNVHYLVSSSAWPQRIFLSRRHCRLVRSAADDSHRLIDSSMTGVYVNDVKIAGSCVLEEGDVVTFGHPKGDTIKAGTRVRQPDSEHQFVFEACQCVAENPHQDVVQTGVHKRHKQLAGAAPTTPEMLGSFRVPKTVPKRKAQSPAVLTHGRPTQGGASSIGSSETTPPSSRRRPQTRSQGRHVTNPGSRSSTRPYTTQKDVGIQSGESSLESDTDTETGFLDETRKTMVKGKASEKDVRNHSKTNHNGNPTLSAPVQSPARPTESLGSKNPVKTDVDTEVSGIDTTEEHVEDHPLDLTLKFVQAGFDNEVDPQQDDQNGHELGVPTLDGKFTSTDYTTNNSKADKQPEEGAQEPSNEQVTVDEQKEVLQQTAQFGDEGNVGEEPSKHSSQDETDMDASAHQGQKDAESAKVVDNDPREGTKAGADTMEDGCLPTPLAIPSKDAFENMPGHSVQSTEEKSVLSKESEEETPDVHGLVEETLSPNKIFEESPKSRKSAEDSSLQSEDNVLVEDDSCGVEGTGIADVLTDEQEMHVKDPSAEKLNDTYNTVKSPKPMEYGSLQSQENVLDEDDCSLEKEEIANVLTDEQEIKDSSADKLTNTNGTVKSPKPMEDSSVQSADNVSVEIHLSLEKKEIADVCTDEQETKDPFADKLSDVDVIAISPKPVEDSMVQSQYNVSVEDHLSLEKKDITDVSTDEQEKKDPFADKLSDVDAIAMYSKPVEDSMVQSPGDASVEDHLSIEKKEIADVSTDQQETKDPFEDKLTDVDATLKSLEPLKDNSIQAQNNVSDEDHCAPEKEEVPDVFTNEQEKRDPLSDKLTDVDTTAMSPKTLEDGCVQSQDDGSILKTTVSLPHDTHSVLREDKPSVAEDRQTCISKSLAEESATCVNTGSSLYQTLASEKYSQAIQDANKDEQDLSPSSPSNQTEEKDSGVKIDDLINDEYKNTTVSELGDEALSEAEGKVTDPTLTEPTNLEDKGVKSHVKASELLQSPKKPEPPCNKSAIDDTTVLQVEADVPMNDGMEKEENDLEETNVSLTSQRTSITPSAEEKENNQMKDSSDHFVQSEPASVDDDDPSISRPSPIIEQLHEKSTLNIAPNDSTAWVLKEFEDLECSPEIPTVSKTCNTKDASQDLLQLSCDVPSSENEREKETIPSSQGSNREFDSVESSDDHMGILRLSPSGRNAYGDNSSQSQSDVENEDVETPLSQNSTYSDFGLSGVVPFVASPTESQEDSREALYSKVVAEIQANEGNTAIPTHFGMQDQGSTRDNNGTTGLKKSVTWEVTDSCLDTDNKENDDPSMGDLDDDFSDRDSRFIISDSIDYRAEDDNYLSESESSSSDEEKPSNTPIEGVGLGLQMSDSEGEAEERRHSSQSVSPHKDHSSRGHQVKDQNKDVSDPQEESYEERKETKISEPTDNEDAPSGNLQDTSTQLTKTEEEKKEVNPLGKIHVSPDDTHLSQVLQTQETGTGELQNMKGDEEDDVKVTESDPRVGTSGISMVIKRSSSHKQQNQDRENDSERDISNPCVSEEEATDPSLESGSKGQLNTESEDQSANWKQLCADNVNAHNHVELEDGNTAIDDQPCVVGAEVTSGSKRPHDENDTVLPQNKRLLLDAQLEKTDNTEVEGFISMDVASEGCENFAEDLPCATEDSFDMQCDVTEEVDTAHLKQIALPHILVKSRANCVRDVVLDFFSHRFFVNKISSKLDKIAEDARKQKVAEEVKKFFASDAWKEQPKTTPMEDSVEPVSETASDSNSSAKKRDDFTHKESSSLEVDKRKVIEHAVYEFFRKKNFAARKKEDLGTEDTVGSETEDKVQTMPNKKRNSEEQMVENAPEAKRPKLQEVSKELDGRSSKDTLKVHEIAPQGPQQPDVCRESIGDNREEVNSSQTYISSSENQDCKTFADIQEDSKDYEVKANQDEQNQTLGRSQQDKNREEISYETSNTNDKDDKETDTFEEMIVAMERDTSDKDGHKLETSTEEMDILVVEPEQHNEKEIMVDTQEVHMQVCMPTGSDSKVDEDEKNNCLSSVALSAEENVKPLEESIEESPAQKEEVVPTKNLPQEDVLSDNTPLTSSPRRGQNTDPANNKDCDEIMPDTASSTHSPIEIKGVQCQDLAEVDSKVDNDVLQSDLPAMEEASLEKTPSSLPSDDSTCPPCQSKEPDQTSQEDVVPEVCHDITVVQEDSGTNVNSDSSLPSPERYSDLESDKDSDYSDNDRFLSSNSMEYGAEFDSDEDMDGSDEDGEDNDSSEDEEDDDDDDGDANSEDDDDDDEDGSSSTPKSPPPSSTAEKTNIASKGCPDTEQNVESSKTAMSGELDYANEVVIKETEMQRNETALRGLSCDFDDDDEFSAPHINIDDIDFDDDNFDDDSNQSMETNPNLHSPVTSVGKDTPAQEKTSKAAVQVSEIEKSKKVTNVALTEENLGLGTSRESAGDPVTRPQAFKSRNLASGKDAGDTTPGVGKDKENYVTQMTEETPGVMPTSAGRTRRRLVDTPGKVTTDNAPRYMEQCQTILASLQGTLDREPSLKDISRVQAWKKEAAKLGEKMSLPETIIAVVGDTGAGKSSLMNALLDQSSVLPTSGMRACTAVVVEVSNNDRNKNYEADVEFLSRKEWDDELRLLLTDLIGEDGKAKRKPDPQSEAGIAWSKIKAVYGRVESYDVLSKLPHVRHLLGTTKHISKSRAREFRSEIDRYVDSMDAPPARGPGSRDRSGGQLWPIVKRVKVQIPNCEVCSSGAILVDLPGVRDSNAARDNIAKQYFKNCNAIWIVASIHRAVDDKTAKELLGEGFRRQLLMDGQYGSIAFICTKTDDLRCSEIIRALNLEDEVEQLENEINALEVQKMSLTEELDSLKEEEEVTDDELSGIQQEVNDLKEGVFELEQTVEPVGDEEVIVDDEDREQLNSLRSILEEKQNTEQETKTSLEDIRSQIADKEKEMAGVERQVSRKQKQMSVMCAKARNQYSQTQIRADFKAGIREMKRKAGMMGEDADSDDDDEEEEAGDQEEEDIARGLRVFTVSSTEYLKLTNKLTRDGPAQVFSSVDDTQIPALREFVHEMTNVRRQSGTEKLMRSLGSFVSDIASYLLDEGTKNHGTRMSAKSIFEHHLGKLKTSLQPVLGTLQTDVDRSISICIHPKLKEGVAAAASMCQAVAKKWGAPTCKENRQAGGLHYSTYKATVRRSGVYKSPTYGPIDMNEDLSSPLYNTITISWQKVFDNGTLFFSLDNCKLSILSTLKDFLLKLRTELQALGMDADRVNRVGQQQLNSTKMRLDNAVAELKEFITGQQREISRVMTPAVQTRMEPAYETCTNERGPGSFNRMRNHMDVHVAYEKDVMFDQASQFLLKQLADLEVDIVARMQVLCDQLCDDLAVLYEPFWEAPVHCTILKKHLMDDMLAIHGKVKTLFEEADLKDLPPLPEPAPQSAVSQSGPDINFSLMNTPGSSNMATGIRPTGSSPVTMVTPNQPTLRMKQELVDNHSYGTHTPSTSQYGVRQLPPGAISMNAPANAVTSRGLGPSFSGVGTHVPANMQPFQASTSTYTSLPHIKKEASPQMGYAGVSTPLLNPTAVNQFRKRTLQGMTGPSNSQATTPPVLKKVKTEEGYFVTMMGQGGQVLRFPVVQTMTQVQQNSCNQQTGAAVSPFLHTCRTAATPVHASNQSLSTIAGSYGGKTGKQPSANVATKSGKASTSTYSTGKSVTSQGLSSAKAKGASSKSQMHRPSNGQTGLIGKSTTKKGGKGKGARGTPTSVPVARQQAGPALRVKQEPRSPLRENQSRKKRKFPPDEIIDLTLDD